MWLVKILALHQGKCCRSFLLFCQLLGPSAPAVEYGRTSCTFAPSLLKKHGHTLQEQLQQRAASRSC